MADNFQNYLNENQIRRRHIEDLRTKILRPIYSFCGFLIVNDQLECMRFFLSLNKSFLCKSGRLFFLNLLIYSFGNLELFFRAEEIYTFHFQDMMNPNILSTSNLFLNVKNIIQSEINKKYNNHIISKNNISTI